MFKAREMIQRQIIKIVFIDTVSGNVEILEILHSVNKIY